MNVNECRRKGAYAQLNRSETPLGMSKLCVFTTGLHIIQMIQPGRIMLTNTDLPFHESVLYPRCI